MILNQTFNFYRKKLILVLFALIISVSLSCKDLIVTEPESNLNVEDFEAAWNRINDVYPYLDFKNINWDSIHTVYRPLAENAKGDEFYFVLRDLLAELKDGHVRYLTKGGGEVYPYYPQRHFKDRHTYNPFVVRKYFDKELQISKNGTVEYEIIPDNIGYAFLSDLHHNYLVKDFPGVFDYLKYTKGLILDIRQKRGGLFDNIEAVVSCFMTEPMLRPDSYWLGNKETISLIAAAGLLAYTKPVVVLINGSTFSAGELCTEILKQLPNVTAVGDTTGGGSCGGNFVFFLPSGKSIYVGALDQRRYDGLPWEWLGIPPDIRVEQTEVDILAERDKQLEFAIEMLK
jgi:hypothetical protein